MENVSKKRLEEMKNGIDFKKAQLLEVQSQIKFFQERINWVESIVAFNKENETDYFNEVKRVANEELTEANTKLSDLSNDIMKAEIRYTKFLEASKKY